MHTLQEGSVTPEKMEHHIPTWQKVLSMAFIVFGFILPITTPFVIFIFERMETRGKVRLAGNAVLGAVCGLLVAGAIILNSLLGINLIPQVLVLVILFLVGRCKCHQDRYQVKNVLYFTLFSTFLFLNAIVIAKTLISLDVTPSLPLTVDFWLVFEENLDSIIQIISMLFFTAVFLNRLAMNLLAKEEDLFRTGRVLYWRRLVNVFKWKNERTSLRSGNETLMKVKNASKILALTCFMLLILLPLLPDIDMTGILDFLAGDGSFDVLEIGDLIIAGFFVILAGFPFILSHMLTWFYTGRMVSYQGKAVARQQDRIWFFMVPIGWIISATAFIPLVLSLLGVSFNTIVTMSLVLNIIAMLALGWIVFQAWLNPKHLLLDPKVKCRKLEAGMIQATRSSSRDGLLKRACHGFLIAVVLGISVLNGIIWFQATFAYGRIVHWYESGFYFWLGVLFIVGPVVLLFFLDSRYIRRLLMGYFAIVLLLLAQQLFKVI
ncbi:hypothetical protein GF325_03175, partial [Candidatus Bathyarchaeota archaeon]|nr:hypothetical protein [Candidatus Bathyarchaeota archaeon]